MYIYIYMGAVYIMYIYIYRGCIGVNTGKKMETTISYHNRDVGVSCQANEKLSFFGGFQEQPRRLIFSTEL